MPIERPQELQSHRPTEMPLGSCTCGAVYAYDATGHNLGTAYIESLVFACNMDWDLAWSLLPEEDYLASLVEKYDLESNYVIPGGAFEGRRVAGALYFVRLNEELRGITRQGVWDKLARGAAEPVAVEPGAPTNVTSLTKKDVEQLVAENQIEPLLKAARHDTKVLRHLQRLLYTSDTLLRFRTAEILGLVSAVIAKKEPAAVANLLQGFSTSFNYSAASSWGAIDAMGEVIRYAPDLFAGYIPVLYQFLLDDALRPQTLRAMGRIANARPDLIRVAVPRLLPFLDDANPETRGYTAWILGSVTASEAKLGLASIGNQEDEVEIYEQGGIVRKTVGRLAAEALEKIQVGH
ncbi:MAG: HEAT repeat domain-containing protein [Candidatus Desulforudis sp.]|nr:HEAT repeat domain-containing protein [Desulforudis sp.]